MKRTKLCLVESNGDRSGAAVMACLLWTMETLNLLTPDDVGAILKISRRAVLRLVERGKLPAIRVGDKILRFDPSQIDAALAARSQQEKAKVSA